MMCNYPLVSIAILNYNGLKLLEGVLEECLQSVLNTDYPNFEVLFVDNGSTDGSVDFVGENFNDPRLRIIENRSNLGTSEGYNVGIRASKGEYIVLLNDDVVVEPNWLKEIIGVMDHHPQIGIAGCKVMFYGSKNLINFVGFKMDKYGNVKFIGYREIDKGQYNTIRYDFDFVLGGASIFRREVFEKVGLHDPDYFIGCEEADMSTRARKVGYEVVYVPTAIVWHMHAGTFKKVDPSGTYRSYLNSRAKLRFIVKNVDTRHLFTAIMANVLKWMGWFICSLLRLHPRLYILRPISWNILNFRNTWKKRLELQQLYARFGSNNNLNNITKVEERL